MRFNFAAQVMERELTPLGYERVRGRAAKSGVILSKRVTADWDLDWSIGAPDLFYFGPNDGSLTLNLKLRAPDAVKKDTEDVLGTAFSISYSALVYGFSTAYMPVSRLGFAGDRPQSASAILSAGSRRLVRCGG